MDMPQTFTEPLTMAGPDPVTTYEQAADLSLYELAEWWSDVDNRPLITERTAAQHCEELTRTAALAEHLAGIRRVSIHSTLRAGVTVTEVAEALGISLQRVTAEWLNWAAGQRDLYDGTDGQDGISPDSYRHVSAVLAEAAAARRGGERR